MFQSLKGFQPKWNRVFYQGIPAVVCVSIPKRVSAKVEHGGREAFVDKGQVSIPKRVSAKVEHIPDDEIGILQGVSIPKRVSAKVELVRCY